MKLQALELRRVEIPLVAPFRTSFGSQSGRDTVLVKAITDVGEGWGEVVTLSEPVYSSESTDLVTPLITNHLAPRLFAEGDLGPLDVARVLHPVIGHRMSKGGVEAAILDAHLRATGQSYASFLGASRDRIPCGVSVSIYQTIPELLDAVEGYLEEGYVRIKLKIEPGWDVEPVKAVREAFGEDIPLQVDANSAYRPGDARLLRRLDDYDLLLIEQPFPEEMLLAHADLRDAIETPVCLDESATSAQVVADAIRLGAVDIVNIKPGRVGGYVEAKKVHDLCVAHGVPVWCGGMVETGIGRAANVALAALEGFTLPGDNSSFSRFYHKDIVTDPMVMVDGHLSVPTQPGMGFEIDEQALDAVTVDTVVLTP